MISIYKVGDKLPALVINGKVYSGFQSVEEIEKTFPQLQTIKKKEVPKQISPKSTTLKEAVVETPTE